jgi:hypothetical protein
MPAANVQGTVTTSSQTLDAIASLSSYPNRGGIQIKNKSANTKSVFWQTGAAATLAAGDEIPPGTAQVISPAQAADTSAIRLIADTSSQDVCISFLGG